MVAETIHWSAGMLWPSWRDCTWQRTRALKMHQWTHHSNILSLLRDYYPSHNRPHAVRAHFDADAQPSNTPEVTNLHAVWYKAFVIKSDQYGIHRWKKALPQHHLIKHNLNNRTFKPRYFSSTLYFIVCSFNINMYWRCWTRIIFIQDARTRML